MLRNLSFAVTAALALAGCAVTYEDSPQPTPVSTYPAPSAPHAPSIYLTAPRAQVHSQLFACHTWGSNIGEVGASGETLQYTPYIDTPAGPLLRDPAETACLSSGFGWRGGDTGRQHNGIDLANAEGGWVFAPADGYVIDAGWRGGFGNLLEIDHGNGVHTVFGHLSEIDPRLTEGAFVTGGTAVARMGMTGNATGVHLHYEVWVGGLLVDPLNYGRPPIYVSAPARTPIPIPDEPASEELPPAPDKPVY